MKSRGSRFQALIVQFLLNTVALNSLIGVAGSFSTVHAQRRVIIVNADQPNLWTMEQAHYLLAQMHRRNLDLKAKSLAELDPNEIAGLRFDVMRMLVEFGATFNQADLASNRLLSANQTFNAERRQELLTERDGLRKESLRLAGEIEELEIQKTDIEDEDAKKRVDARIAAKTTRLAKVDKELEILNGELGTLTAPAGNLAGTTGGATFDPSKLPKSEFDEAYKAAAAKQIEKFNESPQLNASLRLDNFLQMQYEIISKQLSLLRDELGPGERLVFLELPQTINAAYHEANKKWAQSWWKIGGYTKRERRPWSGTSVPLPTPSVAQNQEPVTVTQDVNSIVDGAGIDFPLETQPCGTTLRFPVTKAIRIGDIPASPKPNPLSIPVKALGRVTHVTVTLNGLRHPSPDDLDVMLVGPQGQNAIIMSDVGGFGLADGVRIILDDNALSALPDLGPLANGTFRPTNIHDLFSLDTFPRDTPGALGGSALSVFNGTNPTGTWSLYLVNDSGNRVSSLSGGWELTLTTDCAPTEPQQVQVTYDDVFKNLDSPAVGMELNEYLTEAGNPRILENRMVRTVELIPRQSSLNVNDMKLNVKAGAFNFVLSTLFGFGSKLNLQRQREQFSQFVQQELYSAAFGKGAREFGWTFTPMPGTDRLQSGVRTTYAVVVVPEEATSLVLESNGCYFPRSYYPPNDFVDTKSDEWNDPSRTSRNCSGTTTKAFVVPIPSARVNGGNEFWIEKIDFQPVAKGKRVVVELTGKNFSPQIGVLIDGVQLVQSIGLAQPLIRDDSETGRRAANDLKESEIEGRVERVDSNKVILSFKMPPDYQGTPLITVIAPGRARDINDLRLKVNDYENIKLKDFATKMFGNNPKPDDFRIDKVRIFSSQISNNLTAVVSGAGFINATPTPSRKSDTVARVLVNGTPTTRVSFESATLLTIAFPRLADETIKVTLVSQAAVPPQDVKTIESEAVANPVFLSIANVEVITYEAATEDELTATLVVKITGTGFSDNLQASVGGKAIEVAVKSATEAILTIPDPTAASVVTLEDNITRQRVKVVVARKSKPK